MKSNFAFVALGLVGCLVLVACGSSPTVATEKPAQIPATQSAVATQAGSSAPSRSRPASAVGGTSTDQYVIVDKIEERYVKQGVVPSTAAPATNTLYKGQKVSVYETRGGWARISKYYDGRIEQPTLELKGEAFQVARWIESRSLGVEQPAPAKRLNIPDDPRFSNLPRSPGNGLDERDVLILHAAARYYLETGRVQAIEGGDKSITKPGTYYLMLGEKNKFFSPSDIPDLEGRIRALQK